MPKLIFVTVGISAIENCLPGFRIKNSEMTPLDLVTNDLRRDKKKAEVNLLDENPNGLEAKSKSIAYNLQMELPHFEKSIGKRNMIQKSRKVSAEVASLLVMSKEPDIGEFGKDDEIYLIPSETDAGIVCAKTNRVVLKKRFPHAQIECTEPLQGVRFAGESEENLVENFRNLGLTQFEEIVKEKTEGFIRSYSRSSEETLRILDVTGGFKGLILFAPILCRRYLHKLYYFYQEAKRPIWFTDFEFRIRFEDSKAPIGGNYPPKEQK